MSKNAGGSDRKEKKNAYFGRLHTLLDQYPQILVVSVDNVGSNHMQKVRKALRGRAIILMGKNTMIRRALRLYIEKNPQLESLVPAVKGNIGFVFIKSDMNGVRQELLSNRVGAPAKAGGVAPIDVIVPAGPTGMEPTQTSFLQALNIASKINKGQVEIVNDVHLIKAGDRVGNSEAALLGKLNIKPFSYGLQVVSVYDNGNVYDPSILSLTDADILAKFRVGVNNIASIGLQIGYPTIASLPHSIINSYKNVLAVSMETDYNFPAAEKMKAFLANPGAFSAPAPVEASKGPAKVEAKVEKKEEKKVESEDEDMGFGLFD